MSGVERAWLGVWKVLLLGEHINKTALQDASEELLELINAANGNYCINAHNWLKVYIYVLPCVSDVI